MIPINKYMFLLFLLIGIFVKKVFKLFIYYPLLKIHFFKSGAKHRPDVSAVSAVSAVIAQMFQLLLPRCFSCYCPDVSAVIAQILLRILLHFS